MKPINYYTTLSETAEQDVKLLAQDEKAFLIMLLARKVDDRRVVSLDTLSPKTWAEIERLNQNQAMGLIKALADQCQETLISK